MRVALHRTPQSSPSMSPCYGGASATNIGGNPTIAAIATTGNSGTPLRTHTVSASLRQAGLENHVKFPRVSSGIGNGQD